MKKVFLMSILSLSFIGCEPTSPKVGTGTQADNTEVNARDRNATTKTPLNQSESDADRKITQDVRKALISDDTLSVNAKNIKVITSNGIVTLRGPVASEQEKERITLKLKNLNGIKGVDNQLDIAQ